MQLSLSLTKVLKSEFDRLLSRENWLAILLNDNFCNFEALLYEGFQTLYDQFCKHLITFLSSSELFKQSQKKLAKQVGLKKLVERPSSIQLRTGTKISYPSLYAKKTGSNYSGSSRHLSQLHWGTIGGASPIYASLSCLLSVICPSFDLAKNTLRYLGIKTNFNRVRSLSLGLSERCMEDRAGCQIAPNESLANKRVIIGIDGGRTRTRKYDLPEKSNEKSSKKPNRTDSYKTPWREPKLFVITTIDEKGNINKDSLPIYDISFGDKQTVKLLASYLKRLDIDKATNVQILADGARWIWKQIPEMLLNLGVLKGNIIETLDYYHAMQHLHGLKKYLKVDRANFSFERLSYHLYRGEIKQMKKILKQETTGIDLDEFSDWLYFENNQNRIDYQQLKNKKRPLGSGIVESGIRRVINLRFKAPSSFWYPDNVEKLMLMRAIVLSGRWEIMMDNITKVKC